ncbi:mevalonate kinase [Thiomicrospira sp. XS5]|uniref:mevalonate kinase family protein n=1 Tax=Thiomicrospira sp. XS5 TaxID=1775636 RepID=UPI001365C6FE|nr:GHMP kinase [Thiomicrospira sp. XS5]
MKYITSAPANIMLMGEHSVVAGEKAIACGLNQRLHIEWQGRADRKIHIFSELGDYETHLDNLGDHPKLTWVLAALRHYQPSLTHGLTLTIQSDFKSTLGLGSSAALLAALLGGLDAITGQTPDFQQRFQTGLHLIHSLQGRGSGTDLAASLTGGVVLFDPQAQTVESLTSHLALTLVYCGYKTPTAEVLQKVADDWQHQPDLLAALYRLMGQTTEAAYLALQNDNSTEFYRLVNSYQGLMDALGVNDPVLSDLVYRLRQDTGIAASKISGSGLGDCALGFGQLSSALPGFDPLPIAIDSQGLEIQPL